MQITEIYYQRNFQIGEFLYEHYGVKINVSGNEDIDQAFSECERIVKEQHYLKNKDNSFYAQPKSDEDLPVTQVQEEKIKPSVASEDDVIKEMGTFKLGANIFIAVYGEQVKGNPKLEEAYNKKLAELSK